MKFRYFIITLLCICIYASTHAVNADKFSSPSTVKRELTLEKKSYADKIKAIKKKYGGVKDVAIETWNDGNTYFIIYSVYGWFTIMPVDADKPYFLEKGENATNIAYKTHLEIIERAGYKYLKKSDSEWYFISNYMRFNPQTDFKQFGDKEFIIHDNNPYFIYDLNGKQLGMTYNYEFRPAEPEGYTYDKASDISLYHPALPDRFFGYQDTPNDAKYGYTKIYDLDYYENAFSKAHVRVPGGEYYVSISFPKPTILRNESRSDAQGKVYSFRVFEAESKYSLNEMKLLVRGEEGMKSILPQYCYKVKLSTPDQIAYYTIRDSISQLPRMGCMSLIDYNFRVPALFNDVKVFYKADGNPYAMVRMTALSPYTIYDSNTEYKTSEMSELELAVEKSQWNKVANLTKAKSIDELDEPRFYAWLYAETENLKEDIENSNGYLSRLLTFSLYENEEKNLDATYFSPWQFRDKFSIEDAIEWFSKSENSKNYKTYALMGSYYAQLKSQKDIVETKVSKAIDNYKREKANAQLQAQIERNRMIIEAEQSRSAYAAEQQSNVLCILGMIGNFLGRRTVNQAMIPNSSNTSFSGGASIPKYRPGELLEKTSISPEAVGMAISGGWVPDYSSETTTSTSTSTSNSSSHSSSEGALCHSCYGSGKCSVCNGKGRYMPNLDGKYVDCSLCHKTGVCRICNGQGHH